MDQDRFEEIAERGISGLRMALNQQAPGKVMAFNALYRDQEVVCFGYEDEDEFTTLAILVDPDIAADLVIGSKGETQGGSE